MSRKILFFLFISFVAFLFISFRPQYVLYMLTGALLSAFIIGLLDYTQTKHALRRNFPFLARGRWVAEGETKKIQQYFVEDDINGKPFNREQRNIVYQRAKNELQTVPFGTKHNLYDTGEEWLEHSNFPVPKEKVKGNRIIVGYNNPKCKKPYAASIVNISAMSYGALSKNAIEALNAGAKIGDFAHNTGEGGVSKYHLKNGGDLIWQIGTGYFGCRDKNGNFDLYDFMEMASEPSIKMIEIKLSQGAKPAHGGILPAPKVTPEIAAIRGLEPYKTVVSPPYHTAFHDNDSMLDFIELLRVHCAGKPIGIKFCLGNKEEFKNLVSAMSNKNSYPDFITVDGAEGGTGSAPLEFTNNIGTPMKDALVYVDNILRKYELRDKITVIASGKMITGFDVVRALALGADAVNIARGFLFSLGCIQALSCHNDKCPTGITTHNPSLVRGLVVEDKKQRVANFHKGTIDAATEIVAAAGLTKFQDLRRKHIQRRISPTEVVDYGYLYDHVDLDYSTIKN